MRHLLGTLLAITLLVTGCGGSDEPDTAEDTGSPAASPAEPEVVDLVSISNVGGSVSEQVTPVDDEASLADYASGFEDPERVQEALAGSAEGARMPGGTSLAAAVVGIGCTPPADVTVEESGGEVLVRGVPDKSAGKTVQCLVPVTTVALVAVPG